MGRVNSSVVSSLGYRRIAVVSPRTSVADVGSNVDEIIQWCERASLERAEILVFPELCLTGYTIADLVRLPDLLKRALEGLDRIRHWSTGRLQHIVVGLPLEVNSQLYNVAAVIHDAHIIGIVPKSFLPSTREYYDLRWYASGAGIVDSYVDIGGRTVPFGTDLLFTDPSDQQFILGIELCEDLWAVNPPSSDMSIYGATLILNLSASNELVGKAPYRKNLVEHQSARTYSCYAYASAGPWESTTDTVFSGHCMIAESGEMLAESERVDLNGSMSVADVDVQRCVHERLNANSFNQSATSQTYRLVPILSERSVKTDVRRPLNPWPFVPALSEQRNERCREIIRLQATALAVRYTHAKSKKFVLGISGGLDSTLAALVCEEACKLLGLPSTEMLFVSMPGFGTSKRTMENGKQLAFALGADFKEIDISKSVRQHFADIGHNEADINVVYENAQARERTHILMDLANSVGGLVIGTGDLSELALGWSTFNADHMSMYNVNSGVPKTLVKHLIEWFAETKADVETRSVLSDVLATPISPELLPLNSEGTIAQHTEQAVGPFELHDFFLYHLIRLEEPVRKVVVLASLAFSGKYTSGQIVSWFEVFITRFFANQFKRSTLPDGVKIGSVALSPRADWRMPSDAKPSTWLHELKKVAADLTA